MTRHRAGRWGDDGEGSPRDGWLIILGSVVLIALATFGGLWVTR